jgi:phosphocarrier protein
MTGTRRDPGPGAAARTTITHAVGFHARPSVKFTKLAKKFPCAVEVALDEDGPWIDAKSVVKIMALKAPTGASLHIRAIGEKAEAAVEALRALVERDFDEVSGDAEPA